MKVSKHAVVRFLERVKGKKEFSDVDYKNAYIELNDLFKNVVSNKHYIVVPNYSKFIAVIKNNLVVTILEKFSMFYTNEKKIKRRKNELVCM
jgi:hypothetical protein